jgi:L-threonylcarbamoyladenylate synthase
MYFLPGVIKGRNTMPPKRVIGTLVLPHNNYSIQKAASIIQGGGLVAFPTETVYGLGASAFNEAALKRIFAVKRRPPDNPLIVHISKIDQLNRLVERVPDEAYLLAEHFWPGPLSLVLPRKESVPALVSAGLPTVAVRMPDHHVALQLISAARLPLAAPSANLSGRPSPTNAQHVLVDLAGSIEAVLDGGSTSVGVESTVLDLTGQTPVILRPGGICSAELADILHCPVKEACWDGGTPPSPGMKYRHYAPRARLILVTGQPSRRRIVVRSLLRKFHRQGITAGYLHLNRRRNRHNANQYSAEMARRLYASLRRFDELGAQYILAEELNCGVLSPAVNNRLRKAATRILKVL